MRFKKQEDVVMPHGNVILWRYMTIEKFIDMIVNARIFFANARSLTDDHEITIPSYIIESQRERLKADGYTGPDLDEELARYEYMNHPMRDLTLVNCWSMSREESYALWKIYLGGSRAGVAIRTTFSRLRKSIESCPDDFPENIYAGVVQYKDWMPAEGFNRYVAITTKRSFYSYENEVRLFVLHFPRSEGGIATPYRLQHGRHVSVDLDLLIENIYVSPFVAHWFKEAFERVIQLVSPSLSSRLIVSSIRDE